MAPRVDSRYQYSRAFEDSSGRTYLEVPDPIRFRAERDNITHVAQTGESLPFLAYRYFPGFDRPAQLWWAIAAFNDILDATLPLVSGARLVIPSERFVRDIILAPPPGWEALVEQLTRTP